MDVSFWWINEMKRNETSPFTQSIPNKIKVNHSPLIDEILRHKPFAVSVNPQNKDLFVTTIKWDKVFLNGRVRARAHTYTYSLDGCFQELRSCISFGFWCQCEPPPLLLLMLQKGVAEKFISRYQFAIPTENPYVITMYINLPI